MANSHYGGSLTASGNLGRRPRPETLFKTEVILERLVRFDLAKAQGQSLLSDDDISRVLGRSKRALNSLRGKVPYLRKRIELTTGINTDATEFVETSVQKHKQMLKLLLPNALRVIADAVQTPNGVTTTLAEKKFKVEVARDILDREGSFPKISRTDSHVKMEHDFSEMAGISRELLDSIDGPVQDDTPTEATLKTLAVNKAFTSTESLDSAELEASLAALENMPLSSTEIN